MSIEKVLQRIERLNDSAFHGPSIADVKALLECARALKLIREQMIDDRWATAQIIKAIADASLAKLAELDK